MQTQQIANSDLIPTTKSRLAYPIAFYLPQYHPIPENDKWWGKGFTEWTNVARAKPLFPGHYQPHIPADLGFYDLRLPEVRQAQADLAREYGIYGFCYYHYWFNGKHLLERPFNEVLDSGKPDFPFCLCWANENWTRTWDGLEKHVLIEQNSSEEDDRQHIQWLAKAFQDKRYIRIEGKPLFLVYRASKLPDPLKTTLLWREEARKIGIGEIFLGRVESSADEHSDPTDIGFDVAVEFQPDWANVEIKFCVGNNKIHHRLARKLGLSNMEYFDYRYMDYSSMIEKMLHRRGSPSYKRFPCVTPSFDNSARRRQTGAFILKDSSPELYEKWLEAVIELTPKTHQENFIFINAWNEWAEGNHLEPCQKWGRAYLEATRRAVMGKIEA